METRGDRILFLRRAMGLSQEDFAKKLSVTRGAVGNWERDEGISRRNLCRIAGTFKCNKSWLQDGLGEAFDADAENCLRDIKSSLLPMDRELFVKATEMAVRFERVNHPAGVSDEDFNFIIATIYRTLLSRCK